MRLVLPLLACIACASEPAPTGMATQPGPSDDRPGDAFLERHYDRVLEICGPNTYYPNDLTAHYPWTDHMSADCKRAMMEILGVVYDHDFIIDDSQWEAFAEYAAIRNITMAMYFLLYVDLGAVSELPELAELDDQGHLRQPFIDEMQSFAERHGYTDNAELVFDLIASSVVSLEQVDDIEDGDVLAQINRDTRHLRVDSILAPYSPYVLEVLMHESGHVLLPQARHVQCEYIAPSEDTPRDTCDEDFSKSWGMGFGMFGLLRAVLRERDDPGFEPDVAPAPSADQCINEEYRRVHGP